MPKHASQRAVPAVANGAEPVSVLDAGAPSGDLTLERVELIADPRILPQDGAAPAIVIPADERHRNAGVAQLRERRHDSEPGPRDDRAPLEPEVEQIAVDVQRARVLANVTQEAEDIALDARRRSTQVRVGEDVGGGGRHRGSLHHDEAGDKRPRAPEHAPVLPVLRLLRGSTARATLRRSFGTVVAIGPPVED
jgi:hypothetical protein